MCGFLPLPTTEWGEGRGEGPLSRHPMLKTVQFNREPRARTIEVEAVWADRMLAAEFESSKASRSQRTPPLLFLRRLLAAQNAGRFRWSS